MKQAKKRKTAAIDYMYEQLDRYINENRMDSVKSKLTGEELKISNLEQIVDKFNEDVWKDFLKTEEQGGDDKNVEMWKIVVEEGGDDAVDRIKKNTRSKVGTFVREWLEKNESK